MVRASTQNIKILLGSILILTLFFYPSKSSCLPQNKIQKIEFGKTRRLETITVYLKKNIPINHFCLVNPDRIVVDLKESYLSDVRFEKETGGEIVKAVRAGQNKKNTVRLVVDLNRNVSYRFNIEQKMLSRVPIINILVSKAQKDTQTGIKPIAAQLNSEFSISKPIDLLNSNNSPNFDSLTASTESDQAKKLFVSFDGEVPVDTFSDKDEPKKKSDFSLSAILHIRSTFQAKEESTVENNTVHRNKVLVEGKYKKAITLSALSDYLYFGSENRMDEYDSELHEAKWQFIGEKAGFTIGKQIKRWGKTDQFSPIDTLNPEDFREFIIPDYEERKLPIWMADLNIFFNKCTLEGVFIPFFEKSKFHYFDTNWSIFGHIKKELNGTSLSNALKSYFENMNVHENDSVNDPEFAVRLSWTVEDIDMGLTFHRTTEDFPYIVSFPVKNINFNGGVSLDGVMSTLNTLEFTEENLEVEYKKNNIAGFEFETTYKDLGLRGEAVWEENRSFLTSSLISGRYPVLSCILGADYITEENTYLNFQFLYSHIFDYTSDILYFEKDSFSLLGEFKTDMISDWLQAVIKYNIALNNDSAYLSPYLRYTYITNLECLIGATIFSGDSNTYFGRFKENDLFFLNFLYHF